MGIPIAQVDAFTDQPFSGNPAAVCLLDRPKEAGWMQQVAREMNLSETAFLLREGETFHLRWFTPTIEVDLCGHATLAAAHMLWEWGVLEPSAQARFQTKSGLLSAEKKGEWIELDFPAEPPTEAPALPALQTALGITPKYIGQNRFDYLIEVESEAKLREIKPDFALLATVPCRGVIVTSRSDSDRFDFVSRAFAPRAGINEDPVTGSAHCGLGPFWGERLGKNAFLAYQASARGGVIRVRLAGDRVQLGGKAVTIFQGTLHL
ncbi:MAG: PhzF family phenazine biosynthesis protein [Candidatus Manganitrophaceae bacterium]|nr:MAG: PhzF family phenazine biosynthesis protein [Candidatus Manganitrophaceae bacterium]